MKKCIFLSVVFLFACAVYGQEHTHSTDTTAATYMQVDALIQKGLFKNKTLISQQAQMLTNEQIFSLQNRHTKNYAIPLFLNGAIGFGSGNFYAGDTVCGSIHAVIDTAAILAFAVSSGLFIKNIYRNDNLLDNSDHLSKTFRTHMYVMVSSATILSLNRLASLITASIYIKQYNIALIETLAASRSAVSIKAVPVLSHDQVGFAFNINY